MTEHRGRSPASKAQKQKAREVMALLKAWEKSTGPRTKEGKARTTKNLPTAFWQYSARVDTFEEAKAIADDFHRRFKLLR
jgi:hypothetical protein